MNKEVKGIFIRVKAKGNGVVNYDSSEQGFLLKKLGFDHLIKMNGGKLTNNVNYAKKRFFKNSEGNYDYKLIVSPQAIGKEIFGDEMPYINALAFSQKLFLNMLASKSALLRGYMITQGDNATTLKRKSPITLTELVQTNQSLSYVEVGTKSGERNDTSLYYKENIGEIEYQAQGFINTKELSFVSVDSLYDRQALNPDNFEEYKAILQKSLPNFDSNIGLYKTKNDKSTLSERGFIFDNDSLNDLIMYYLTQLTKTQINRKNAFLNIVSVEVKPIYDVLNDLYDQEDGWETFNPKTPLNWKYEAFYQEVDETIGESLRNEYFGKSENKTKSKKNKKDA